MNKCIYTLKADSEETFSSQEHIISAALGGVKKLPMGYVCDGFNNSISCLEREFVQRTPIMLDRIFQGIGHRGSRNYKDRTKSGIVPLFDCNTNEFKGLGFMDMSIGIMGDIQSGTAQSIPIPSLSFSCNKDGKVKLLNCEEGVENYKTFLNSFIEKLLSNDEKKYETISDKRIPVGEVCMGFYQKDKNHLWFYVAINEETDFDDNLLLDWSKITLPHISSKLPLTAQEELYQPKATFDLIYCSNDFSRIPAKYLFNALAELNGQDFMFKSCFNSIREWIAQGGENFFCKMTLKDFDNIVERYPHIPQNSHIIYFQIDNGRLFGQLSLFRKYKYMAIMSHEIDKDFNDMLSRPKIYVCDWENKNELIFDM